MWVRDKGSNARMTLAGRPADIIAPGRARFWFFPDGVGAEGELTGRGAYDCAGVFVDPSFLPSTVKQVLAEPIAGFTHDALGRAFDELGQELAEPDAVLPLFTEGWAMQALAYVARASRSVDPVGATIAQWPGALAAAPRQGNVPRRSVREPVASTGRRGVQAVGQPFLARVQGIDRRAAA